MRRGLRTGWTSFPIARLYDDPPTSHGLSIWRDRNLRFHIYDLLPPSKRIADLFTEIDRDPTCIFLGITARVIFQVVVGGGQDGAVVVGPDTEEEPFALGVQQV